MDVVVNPEGYSRRTVFNNFGLPVEMTDENGAKTRLAYDGRRNLTSVITSTGRRTSWEYDEYDRVIKRTLPDGNSFSYTYEGGALKTITDMEGRIYTLKFNSRQELQQLVFPNGIHRTWEYDERGRLVKATDVKGNVTSYSYDDADNLIRLHEPDGNVHEFSYDTSGNLIVASDRLRKVEFEYGPLGTLIGRRQLDHHVRFRYDGELQLREIINEGGECYSFRLDGLGRVVEETGFDGLQRKYLRDGAGRVIRVVRPEGRQTEYEYDGVGNILQETQHDGRTSRFAYDEDGRLLRAENKEIKVAFKHDLGGRIVKETQGGHCIMRKYDRTGRHVHTESSLGASIDYSHDKDGNLSEMNSGGWSARWQRDRVGLETERELTGGVHVKTHHDSLGRETYKSVGARNVEQFRRSYTWGIGNRLHATEDGLTGRRVRYDYDEFDNLLSAEYKQGNDVERIYRIPDRIGNLFETREKDDRKYGAGSRLTEDRDYFYHYDCEGNLVFKEFRTLDWAGVMIGRVTVCCRGLFVPTARKCHLHTMRWVDEPRRLMRVSLLISCGMAMYLCMSGRRFRLMPKRQTSQPGSSNRTRSFLLPSSLPTARASPSCLTTSALPCRHLTITATRYGSRSLTSSAGRGRATIIPPSFRLSTRGSMRTLRRGCTTTASAITNRIQELILARIRLGWWVIILHCMGMLKIRIYSWTF